VTISVGLVAGYPTLGLLTGEGLLRAADTALYCAKRSGRNRVERAAEMQPASQARASARLSRIGGTSVEYPGTQVPFLKA
jgi:hypothetical protein